MQFFICRHKTGLIAYPEKGKRKKVRNQLKKSEYRRFAGKIMTETASSSGNQLFSGKVVYVYAFDIAYEIRVEKVEALLESPLREYAIGPGKRNPKYYFFYRPKLARLPDELTNITKFFGDWHLAKVYRHLFERFHLSQWHQGVGEKLRTLGRIVRFFATRAELLLDDGAGGDHRAVVYPRFAAAVLALK